MDGKLDNIVSRYEKILSNEDKLFDDNIKVQEILPYLIVLQNHKEKFYGDSWRKYGDVGAFMNIARKWDRIDTIMKNAMENGVSHLFDGSSELSTETILDTIIDLSIYGLMWSSYIASRYPNIWNKFLELNDLAGLGFSSSGVTTNDDND